MSQKRSAIRTRRTGKERLIALVAAGMLAGSAGLAVAASSSSAPSVSAAMPPCIPGVPC
jgi:hypothetical protein